MRLARNLRRHRTTAAILICTLAPAVGAVTALHAALDRVLLADHGVRTSSQIFHLAAPYALWRTRPDRAEEIRHRAATSKLIRVRAFAKPATVFQLESEAIVDWGIRAVAVSPEFFDLVGVLPQLGAPFVEGDLGRRPTPALISDRLWRTRFAADSQIVGRVVEIPGSLRMDPWTIVGVMPRDFEFPRGANFWLPYDPNSFAPSLTPDFVRIHNTTTDSQLEQELVGVVIRPFAEYVLPQGGRMLTFLFVGVTLFVLVAWVQASTRVLTQLAIDAPATALRLSLGARPFDLCTEVAQEACFVGTIVLVTATATTYYAARFLGFLLPPEFLASGPLSPSAHSWAFLSAIVASGTLLWILTARSVIKRSDPAVLRGGSSAALSVRSAKTARGLFILQMAVVTALLYQAFLANRSYQHIAALNLGFDAANLVATPIPVWAGVTRAPGAGPSFESRYREQSLETLRAIRSLNGVSAASFTDVLPLSGQGVLATMSPGGDAAASVAVVVQSVGSGFFATIGASLLAGREPEPSETRPQSTGPLIRPAVINERLARLLSPSEPVPSVELWASPSVRYRIVGVLRNIPTGAMYEPPAPALYAFLPDDGFGIYLMVRSQAPSIRADIRRVMTATWGESVAPRRVVSVSETLRGQALRYQASALVFSMLLVVTFPVALLGLAGSVTDEIRRRLHRTTLEAALGASPSRIRWSILADVLHSSAIGACAGIIVGVVGGIAARGALFGVRATDPTGIVICTILPLMTVGLLAAVLAWRAGDVNFAVLRRVDRR